MKQVATILALTLISSMAQAQSCVELCNVELWLSATQVEIEEKIATADVDARNDRGETALFSAANVGTPEVVDALLAAGADVGARSDNGWTALFEAAIFLERLRP